MTDERADRPAIEKPPTGQPFDYEIQFKALVLMTIGVLALVLVAALAMYLLVFSLKGWRTDADDPPPVLEGALAPLRVPGPKLLATPEGELAKMVADDERLLGGYAWVDREAGIASIPIERALALVAEQGLAKDVGATSGEAASPQPVEPATPVDEATPTPGVAAPDEEERP
jgi:hypothetical protein